MGSQAMACPDLAGKYLCTLDGYEFATEISVSQTNGIYTYKIDEVEYIADGIDHPKPDQISEDFKVINKKYVTTCNGEYLNTVFTGQMYQYEQLTATFRFDFKNFISNKNLHDVTTATITKPNGESDTTTIEHSCKRQK